MLKLLSLPARNGARDHRSCVDDVCRQNFQRDFAIELRVVSEINLTHATRAELGANFVAADLFARGERQISHIGGVKLGSNEASRIVAHILKGHKKYPKII